MNSTVSEKGQVTIPKKLRDGLGLSPGSILDFSEEDGRLVARKVVGENPIAKWRGKGRLPKGLSVDRYLSRTRDGR
ncbi:MAG: AbrB/MazE/SpoVT family DNA-binding domain-containing protein [Opitutaceae bacterium]